MRLFFLLCVIAYAQSSSSSKLKSKASKPKKLKRIRVIIRNPVQTSAPISASPIVPQTPVPSHTTSAPKPASVVPISSPTGKDTLTTENINIIDEIAPQCE